MRVIFTQQECEDFKKTRDCTHMSCEGFSCYSCPLNNFLEAADIDEAIEFIENHLEK